jgi:MFS superfamily sulfate permease-like transporter
MSKEDLSEFYVGVFKGMAVVGIMIWLNIFFFHLPTHILGSIFLGIGILGLIISMFSYFRRKDDRKN